MRVADQGEEGSGACTRIRAGGAAVCPPQLPQLQALNAMIGRGCSRIVASPILHEAVR
jgi:hypothetical protein